MVDPLEPSWTLLKRQSGREIVIVFTGVVDEATGQASAEAFLAALPDDGVDLVLDVVDVHAYRTAARKSWQSAVWPRRKLIRSLTVLSSNAVTRMGAKLFATALGIPCTVLDESERQRFAAE